MNLIFSGRSWNQYLHWQRTDPKLAQRINDILADAMRQPFSGLGKPKPLKGNLRG